MPHRVVIIGGGFGGLNAPLPFKRSSISVTLIDRRNFHLFQPLLYQVATGGLSPRNIASPLRSVLRKRRNVTTLLGEVIDLDPVKSEVILQTTRVPYDSLILATGARHHYFGHDDRESLAPGLPFLEPEFLDLTKQASAF